ncbi:MAG TPA: outer membrane beta-barrel protein, partial [Pontiella sp.]
VTYTLDALTYLTLGAGHDLRVWDDEDYGKGLLNNNFNRYSVNGTLSRELRPYTTEASIVLDYTEHEYEGDRGGYETITARGTVDHNFNPDLSGSVSLGYSFSEYDSASNEDAVTPYAQCGLIFSPGARTTLTADALYSLRHSDNSVYNAQNTLALSFGAKRELTAKISLSSSLSYELSDLDADSAVSAVVPDDQLDVIRASARCSYQINRNNFVDLNYSIENRSADTLEDMTRNRVDFGWRLRL